MGRGGSVADVASLRLTSAVNGGAAMPYLALVGLEVEDRFLTVNPNTNGSD